VWATSTDDARILAALTAVIGAVDRGELAVELCGVVLAPRAGFVAPRAFAATAGAAGIPVVHRDDGDTGDGGDGGDDPGVLAGLDELAPDLVLLVGYQWIVGAELLDRHRVVNVHPALPDGPIGHEDEVLDALVDQRARTSGLTAHVVTPALDRGPVLTFARFEVTPTSGWPPRVHARRALVDGSGRCLAPFVVATLDALGGDPSSWPPDPPAGASAWPLDLTVAVGGPASARRALH